VLLVSGPAEVGWPALPHASPGLLTFSLLSVLKLVAVFLVYTSHQEAHEVSRRPASGTPHKRHASDAPPRSLSCTLNWRSPLMPGSNTGWIEPYAQGTQEGTT
jgi:hypothetical protein